MAQLEISNWTFGRNAGLSWSPDKLRNDVAATGMMGTPNGTLDNMPTAFWSEISTLEGCFTISDKQGNMLFYSDGIKIWKADGTQIFDGLGGHYSSMQSGIVLPFPGTENRYICVGLDEGLNNRMTYVIIQANSPDDVTVVTPTPIPFQGHTGTLGESMTAIEHANGVDWWIIAPGVGSAADQATYYNAWLVTPAGVQSSAPKEKTSLGNPIRLLNQGYIKFTFDGRHFAHPSSGGYLTVGDFDNSTGIFSNFHLLSPPPNQPGYGTEFSPNNKYLYTSTNNNTSIWDFEGLLDGSVTTPMKTYTTADLSGRVNALQIDRFGRIWGMQSGSQRAIVFDNPDEPDNVRIYMVDNLLLTGTRSETGLPSFSASWFYQPVTGPDNFCMNEQQTFSFRISKGAGAKELSHTEWDFGDGMTTSVVSDSNFSTGEQSQSYRYRKTGKYTITIRAFLLSDGSEVETLRQTHQVTVQPCLMPVNPNIHLIQ